MDVDVDAREVLALARRFGIAESVVKRELANGLTRLALQGERFAKQHIDNNNSIVTGNMRRNTTHQAASPGSLTAKFGTNAKDPKTGFPYPLAVEKGRKGFSAGPGKTLAFTPRVAGPVLRGAPTLKGGMVFVKRVGPAAARPFIRPARDQVRQIVPKEMRAVMQAITSGIGGGA